MRESGVEELLQKTFSEDFILTHVLLVNEETGELMFVEANKKV